jgi:hypothetical protein
MDYVAFEIFPKNNMAEVSGNLQIKMVSGFSQQ